MYTQHNSECKMSFGRPTKQEGICPRCDELRSGAKPRKSKNEERLNLIRQYEHKIEVLKSLMEK